MRASKRPPAAAAAAVQASGLEEAANLNGEMARIWPSLCESQRAIIIATAKAFAGIERPAKDAPALSRPAALIFNFLKTRPQLEATPQRELLDMLSNDYGIYASASTFYSRYVPQLKQAGVTNAARRGWSLPEHLKR